MGPFVAPLNIAFYYTFADGFLIAFSNFKKLFYKENSKDLVLFMKTETFNASSYFVLSNSHKRCFRGFYYDTP
jgi:hypothetical protein